MASALDDGAPAHAAPSGDVARRLDASPEGLTPQDAAQRLAEHGPNELPSRRAPPFPVVFARQFKSPLIYVLAIAAAVSLAVGERLDAAFIAVVLAVNALVGSLQEWHAERSIQALSAYLRSTATVLRGGEAVEVDARDLVVGDVVLLESGGRVPADVRLLRSHGLEVDESLLTGESVPVEKDASWTGEAATPLADRRNMSHAGSVVVRGRGRGVVVATGTATAVGDIAAAVTGQRVVKPPLIHRLERFSRSIGVAVVVAAVVAGAVGVTLRGFSVREMFVFVVALAVSAIPEGLPVATTVALAAATTRMARRHVIVRRLTAVEGLGSCTYIATDKTGTLTVNALTVRRVRLASGVDFDVTGEGYVPEGHVVPTAGHGTPEEAGRVERLTRVGALVNEGHLYHRDGAWGWRGDPTDVALLVLARKLGWEGRDEETPPEVAAIPFEPEHRFAATFHTVDEGTLVAVKGAPEVVVRMCSSADGAAFDADALHAAAEELSSTGYRVLALAEGHVDNGVTPEHVPPEPTDLTFLGFVGMIDPLRPGVREAVRRAQGAGITVTMITGDHPVTALAIARDLGLAQRSEEVATGADVDTADEEDLRRLVAERRVFARVAPDHKLRLVEAAKSARHFVAVTGDGVNDAPALRAAHVGVAMGQAGTDVAREAADLVVSDDDFTTIVDGIEEGRIAYDNIRKVVFLLVSTGAAELALILLGLALGLPLVLFAVQLLWLNIVTNGIQHLALAVEPGEPGLLERPPRPPGEPVFDRLMIERTMVSAVVMGSVGIAAFAWFLDQGWSEEAARNAILLLMVLFENVHLGNARSETRSIFRISPLKSPLLVGAALLALGVHVVAMYTPPLQAVLGTAPVSLETWALLAALALTVAVAMEVLKLTWRLRYG